MILTIKAELSEPPTEPLPFRDVTMASKHMQLDVLIECNPDLKDLYWRFLKPRGMLDYVDYLIAPQEEKDSIRLDTEFNFSRTVVVNRIIIENSSMIIRQIKTALKY